MITEKDILHFTNIGNEEGQVYFKMRSGYSVYYSKDFHGAWNQVSSGGSKTIKVAPGETLYVESTTKNNTSPCLSTLSKTWIQITKSDFSVGGSILSLLNGGTESSFTPKGSAFMELFNNSSGIVQIEPGLLPSLTVDKQVYYCLFSNCTRLVRIPAELLMIPISSGVKSYAQMFFGCTSLKEINVPWLTWPDCEGWVAGVAEYGDLYCYDGLPLIRDTSHIPPKWTIHVIKQKSKGLIVYNHQAVKGGIKMPEEKIYPYQEV